VMSFAKAHIGDDMINADTETSITRKEDMNYWSRLLQLDMRFLHLHLPCPHQLTPCLSHHHCQPHLSC
jgi:hypothetical protein